MSEEQQQAEPRVTGAPDRIVLCVGDIPVNTAFSDLQEVTWCASSQNNADIEYVRADLCTAPQAEMTPPEVLASRLIDTWCAVHGAQIPWEKAVEISAIVTKMPDAEYARLLALDDAAPQLGLSEIREWVIEHRPAMTLRREPVDRYMRVLALLDAAISKGVEQ